MKRLQLPKYMTWQMKEGTVLQWHVTEGTRLWTDMPLVTLRPGKKTVRCDIGPGRHGFVLHKRVVAEGERIDVKGTLALAVRCSWGLPPYTMIAGVPLLSLKPSLWEKQMKRFLTNFCAIVLFFLPSSFFIPNMLPLAKRERSTALVIEALVRLNLRGQLAPLLIQGELLVGACIHRRKPLHTLQEVTDAEP